MLYVVASARAVDLATGAIFWLNAGQAEHLEVSADNRYVLLQGESVYATGATVRHSTLGGNAIHVPQYQAAILTGGRDSAVSPDASRVYGTDATPHVPDAAAFPLFNRNGTLTGSIPSTETPNNTEVSWQGIFAGGIAATYELTDIRFYDAAGELIGSDSCTGVAESTLLRNTVRFSGDGLRYLCSAEPAGTDSPRYTWIRDVPVP
jgi:hypothetical protein